MQNRACALLAASLFVGLTHPASAASASAESGFDVPADSVFKNAPAQAAFPNSGAVTLRDESVVQLNADGSASEVTHETVKIFNQRGRGFADVSIPFNASTQAVTAIHARTIRPDGKVLVVKPEEIHVGSPYSDYTMYDDAKTIGISMPGVEDGAIVEYTYKTETRKSLLPGQYANQWTFQDGENPVIFSRLAVTAPSRTVLNSQEHNTTALKPLVTPSSDGTRKTYVWELRNLPDITPEPLMPPTQTLLPWVEVSTVPSWQSIAKWYQTLATPRISASPEVKAQVAQLCAGKTSDTEKAKAIFYWVEGKTRYVALELGLSAYQPHAATEVCQNRYGDCKDMATLLITMLHEAGIKTAWPVLLSAGNTVPLRDNLASPGSFDHAIARADIDGKPYWFDCTAELCSWGDIPQGDRGADAFVIRDGVGTFETIPMGTPSDNVMTATTHVRLAADGSADCDTATTANGDVALAMRSTFRSVKPDQLKTGFQNLIGHESPDAMLTSFTLSPPEDRDKPMGFTCVYHAPLWALKTGSLLIYTPHSADNRLFSLPERKFSLYQAHASKMVSEAVITAPAGYSIVGKPADVHETTPLGRTDVTYTVNGNTITQHMEITEVPATVSPVDYPRIKAQYESIVAKLREPIVFQPTTAK